ncbi:uncharacterized protein VICG_00669 [Vittaforma corneae ATCC 50505]|uniref:Dolichol-phosphate mannosyltransferase subunit 1 n=1 Tax=Vittaforma corneae (strain ATCC 50505) TaxID=993615 RepID=L2GP34_VITCO|nr:uncharacterized protein VICG_00669 [Vittaforma corneae ATCC 50505]ELA42270.1 hypothetical protein VICG_00669 [Vittaforma corneae ATCC 50505]
MINVLISTYNEVNNICPMLGMVITTLEKLAVPFLIIVVDGNSPDGTSNIVKKLNHPNIKIVDEKCKSGLGNSYMKGLEFCKYEYTVILDADLQHDPFSIFQMFSQATSHNKYDIVTGTRYSKSGMVSRWSFKRKFISAVANNLAKYVLGLKSSDLTGSFRCYRTEVLKTILSKSTCKGFGIQLELIARAEKMKCQIAEVSIIFYDRVAGDSKFGLKEIYLFLKTVLNLYITI